MQDVTPAQEDRSFPLEGNLNVPVRYLMGTSDTSLESFMLKRLNEAARLRKEAKAIEQEAQEMEVVARVAGWLHEHRTELLRLAGTHLEKLEETHALMQPSENGNGGDD